MNRLLPCLVAASLLAGCATPQNSYDPLESVNRPIYTFNRGVDKLVLKPVATAWDKTVPQFAQDGVHNFFENIADLFSIPPALLQGKGSDAAHSFGRVVVNTTLGMAGLFDPASSMELKKSDEDFGQALGHWGLGSGPYLMLPLLGPTTGRDIVDPAVRIVAGPTAVIESDTGKIVYTAVNAVDARDQLLPLDKTLDEQYDEYSFVRDSYLQRRWFKLYDGNLPHKLKFTSNGDDEDETRPAVNASEPAARELP